MRFSLIINPSAGGGRAGRALVEVQTALQALGVEHHVQRTRSLDHARELAQAAMAASEVAVAVGGDGLIGAVADALKHSEGVLGVLPGGRGNDFARALGIPLDPTAACQVLATGVIRALDLGQVESVEPAGAGSIGGFVESAGADSIGRFADANLPGGQTFIGIASCGFDSVANRIANETRLVRGNLVYAYGALRALAGWRPATFTVTVDGGAPRTIRGYTVAAANSKYYGGGMLLAPDATLQDGLLDVVVIAHTGKLRFLALLPTVFKGEHVRHREVEIVRGATVEIAASRPFTMYADGDPIAELPVTVRALPGAIRVLLPA